MTTKVQKKYKLHYTALLSKLSLQAYVRCRFGIFQNSRQSNEGSFLHSVASNYPIKRTFERPDHPFDLMTGNFQPTRVLWKKKNVQLTKGTAIVQDMPEYFKSNKRVA